MNLDIVFKAFVGVLAAVIIIGSGLGVTAGFSQTVAADNYMESVAKTIVESNYSPAVISSCIPAGSRRTGFNAIAFSQIIHQAAFRSEGFAIRISCSAPSGIEGFVPVRLHTIIIIVQRIKLQGKPQLLNIT